MVDYDPFEKPFNQLSFDDLSLLKEEDVSEGYYVEYKRSIPGSNPGRSIARVIASFANTYGGWLFLGISEDFNNSAGYAHGISLDENPQPKETVQQWAHTRIDPTPKIQSHLIPNPDRENFAVLIVKVPWSWNTPHVLTDGKIYRRTGEANQPIEPETDRWILDRLFHRRREYIEQKTRAIQHLRALAEEIRINERRAEGNRRVIRHLQEGRSRDIVDDFVVELFSTDSWDAALHTEFMDTVEVSLYRDIQQLYYSIKPVNDLILRLQNENRQSRTGGGDWTVVNYWDEKKEEVAFTGIPPLIYNRIMDFYQALSRLPDVIDSEIERLEEELGQHSD